MRKILLLTLLILLFAHPSAQAKENLKIRSAWQTQTEDEQAVTDSEQAQADSQTEDEQAVVESEQAQADSEKVQTDSGQIQTDSRADDVKPEEAAISYFDYEALALLSVELNPYENPDLVISLLKPYKDDEDNKSFTFYRSLGLAYKNTGRFKEAIPTYVRALEIKPDQPAAQYYLGITYYKNNESPKALKYFLKSSAQKPDHPVVKKWIDKLIKELDICKAPDISNMKEIYNGKVNVNKQKNDRETRLRMYITQDGGLVHVWSVKNKIYSYGIGCDTKKPEETWKTFMTSNVDYIIIDTDGDGVFEKVINSTLPVTRKDIVTAGNIFGVPTWAYNPE
ncbi:MAG: tetratricopeptide repeat protein [Candidatus Neomarinimicrobiota bacterium]|nr:tetratricopeptide repeat protein [Candidatus Neomarinimicrobiota bacterium]